MISIDAKLNLSYIAVRLKERKLSKGTSRALRVRQATQSFKYSLHCQSKRGLRKVGMPGVSRECCKLDMVGHLGRDDIAQVGCSGK